VSARHALAFLTRLPGGSHPDDERGLGHSVPWFPLIGALVGAIVGAIYWATSGPLGSTLAAVTAITVGVIITGAFHEDGLADTADGLGGMEVERRLAIMKDSRVGTFGSLAIVLSSLARVTALAGLGAADGWFALIAAHTIGRTMATLVMITTTPARADGLGTSYTDAVPKAAVLAVAGLVVCGAVGGGPASTVGLIAAAVGASAVAVLAKRAFGGTTGDVLGAVEQIGELGVLIAISRLVIEQGWGW